MKTVIVQRFAEVFDHLYQNHDDVKTILKRYRGRDGRPAEKITPELLIECCSYGQTSPELAEKISGLKSLRISFYRNGYCSYAGTRYSTTVGAGCREMIELAQEATLKESVNGVEGKIKGIIGEAEAELYVAQCLYTSPWKSEKEETSGTQIAYRDVPDPRDESKTVRYYEDFRVIEVDKKMNRISDAHDLLDISRRHLKALDRDGFLAEQRDIIHATISRIATDREGASASPDADFEDRPFEDRDGRLRARMKVQLGYLKLFGINPKKVGKPICTASSPIVKQADDVPSKPTSTMNTVAEALRYLQLAEPYSKKKKTGKKKK